jgi:hypothetical protein
VGKFQPNAAILDKLRSEMLKLSEDLVRKELSNVAQNGTSSTASGPPNYRFLWPNVNIR